MTKILKKSISLLLAMILAAGLFAGCQSSNGTGNATPAAGATQTATPGDTQAAETSQAPATTQAAEKSTGPKIVKLFLPLGIDTLDPHLWTWGTHYARMGIFEGLTKLDNNYKPMPANAESWTHNDDYTVWTFKLRSDLKWSDGTPLTAKDYEYSFKRAIDPNTSVGSASSFITGVPILNAKECRYGQATVDQIGVKALDDTTLEITMSKSWPILDVSLTESWALPVPQKVIEAKGKEWITQENIVSNGPYKVKSFVVNTSIELEKNTNYYGTVNLDGVQILNASDPNASNQVLAYQNGDINIASLTQADVELINSDASLSKELTVCKSGIVYFMQVLKSENDILQQNPKVRQAIAMSIDKGMIAKDIMKDTVRAANSLVPEIWASWGNDIGLGYDTAKAKQLMTEAGYPDGQGFPEMTILIAGNPTGRELAIADMITKGTGIKTKILNEEYGIYVQDTEKMWPKDTIGYYISGWGTPIATYSGYFLNDIWDVGLTNLPAASMKKYTDIQNDNSIDAGKKNKMLQDILDNETSDIGKQYRSLVAQAENTADPAQKEAILKQAAQIREESAGAIALDWENGVKLVKPEIKGFVGNALLLGTPPLYFNDVSMD